MDLRMRGSFDRWVSIALGLAIVLGSPVWAEGQGEGQDGPFFEPIGSAGSPVLPGWEAPAGIGDYREHIQPTPWGYLRWQRFPVRVAIEPVAESPGSAAAERDQRWVAALS